MVDLGQKGCKKLHLFYFIYLPENRKQGNYTLICPPFQYILTFYASSKA